MFVTFDRVCACACVAFAISSEGRSVCVALVAGAGRRCTYSHIPCVLVLRTTVLTYEVTYDNMSAVFVTYLLFVRSGRLDWTGCTPGARNSRERRRPARRRRGWGSRGRLEPDEVGGQGRAGSGMRGQGGWARGRVSESCGRLVRRGGADPSRRELTRC